LTRHPQSAGGAVQSIIVRLERAAHGTLALRFTLEGQISRVHVPPPQAARFVDGLWQHTCCEIFIAPKGSTLYREFNFSPSGEWAAYEFRRYREGAPLADTALNPRIAVRRGEERLELEARVPCPAHACSIALCAVIEDQAGVLSYWALKHPSGKPDFHHPAGFALELDEVRD
jgi:hypothetical protein